MEEMKNDNMHGKEGEDNLDYEDLIVDFSSEDPDEKESEPKENLDSIALSELLGDDTGSEDADRAEEEDRVEDEFTGFFDELDALAGESIMEGGAGEGSGGGEPEEGESEPLSIALEYDDSGAVLDETLDEDTGDYVSVLSQIEGAVTDTSGGDAPEAGGGPGGEGVSDAGDISAADTGEFVIDLDVEADSAGSTGDDVSAPDEAVTEAGSYVDALTEITSGGVGDDEGEETSPGAGSTPKAGEGREIEAEGVEADGGAGSGIDAGSFTASGEDEIEIPGQDEGGEEERFVVGEDEGEDFGDIFGEFEEEEEPVKAEEKPREEESADEDDFLGLGSISGGGGEGDRFGATTEILFEGIEMDFDEQISKVTLAEVLLAQGKEEEASGLFREVSSRKGVTHWVSKRLSELGE